MDNKTVFGIMCILFNQIGVPCFLQGNKEKGIKRIIFGVITCGVIAIINMVKGIILGIKILKMTDEEYAAIDKTTLDSGIPA